MINLGPVGIILCPGMPIAQLIVEEVRVEPGEDPAMVLIHIAYRHVRDGSPGNLVYPFYLA